MTDQTTNTPQPRGRFLMISRTLAEIDQTRGNWDEWRKNLTDEQRQRLREIEARIDASCNAGDRPGLEKSLMDLKMACIPQEESPDQGDMFGPQ